MRLEIRDRQLLAWCCQRVERWEGSQHQAARQLGIGVGSFSRLRNAKTGNGMNGRVFHRLFHYLPPDAVSERARAKWKQAFGKAVWAPAAIESLTIYARWLKRELRRFTKDWRDGWPRYREKGDDLYSVACRTIHTLRHRYPAEFAPLKRASRNFTSPAHYASGITVHEGWSTSLRRLELARLRIVEPLIGTTGGIELSTRDLSRADLRAYLRVAVKREVLLLAREPDLQRAQRTTTRFNAGDGQPLERAPE